MASLRPLVDDYKPSDIDSNAEMETLGWLMEILERSLEYSARYYYSFFLLCCKHSQLGLFD